MQICCGGSSPFLWTVQVDAAAELEDDDERCGTVELERQEGCERKEMKKREG